MSHYQLCGYVLCVPLSLLLEHVFSSVDEHILIHIHMIRNLILKRKQSCCVPNRKKSLPYDTQDHLSCFTTLMTSFQG